MGPFSRHSLACLGLLGLGLAGCDGHHLLLVSTVEVRDLGSVVTASSTVPPVQSAPVLASDGQGVIYLGYVAGGRYPVVRRDLSTFQENTLFSVANSSMLWAMNQHSSTLLFSIADASGSNRQIVEYTLQGAVRNAFDCSPGWEDLFAAVSPDGSLLACVRRSKASGDESLMVRNATNSALSARGVSPFSNGEIIRSVHWLDNQRLLVSSVLQNGTAHDDIRFLSSRIDFQRGMGFSATPDPSGQRMVSIPGPAEIGDWSLSLLDGQEMTQLTNSQTLRQSVNWSADGRAFVYLTIGGGITRLEAVFLPPLR